MTDGAKIAKITEIMRRCEEAASQEDNAIVRQSLEIQAYWRIRDVLRMDDLVKD